MEGLRVNVADASYELAKLVSWQRAFRTFQGWQAVEQALAVRLPDDYKRFMATFPSGKFRGLVGVNNPIESEPAWVSFHWEFFDTLDRAKGWRDYEPERVPYPIFPEPGGVIPWGDTDENHEFFWLPRSENPDEWSVVFSTADFERWGEYHGTMSEFVLGLVSGDFRTDLIQFSAGVTGPLFEATGVEFAADVPQRELATSPNPDYWDSSSLMRELSQEDHVRSVDVVSYLQGAGNARQIDWVEVEDRLSVVLPTDYKQFVESVGAGELLGIRIFRQRRRTVCSICMTIFPGSTTPWFGHAPSLVCSGCLSFRMLEGYYPGVLLWTMAASGSLRGLRWARTRIDGRWSRSRSSSVQ